jgi:putative SOS response-associated peptidase YedK
MCGRYTSTSAAQVAAVFAAEEVRTDELHLRYSVAPSQQVYAIAERRAGDAVRTRPCKEIRV